MRLPALPFLAADAFADFATNALSPVAPYGNKKGPGGFYPIRDATYRKGPSFSSLMEWPFSRL